MTPLVELDVHRGTVSALRRRDRGHDDDADSVISEDLGEYDDEYKLVWERKPGLLKIFCTAVCHFGETKILMVYDIEMFKKSARYK